MEVHISSKAKEKSKKKEFFYSNFRIEKDSVVRFRVVSKNIQEGRMVKRIFVF